MLKWILMLSVVSIAMTLAIGPLVGFGGGQEDDDAVVQTAETAGE